MDQENLKKMVQVIKVMEAKSIRLGNLGMVFERQTLNGIVYRNELGYCSIGDTEGQAIFVNSNEFENLTNFIDILRAKKTISNERVDFRMADRVGFINRLGIEEINMHPWTSGQRLEVNPTEIFNAGTNVAYFLLGKKFCFDCPEYFGMFHLSQDTGMRVKISSDFVQIFELGWTGIRLLEQGVTFTNSDLEVLLLSGVEGTEEERENRYDRLVVLIKEKKSFSLLSPEAFHAFLDGLTEMRRIGADMVGIEVNEQKLFLSGMAGIGMRRQLDIPFKGKFSGSLFGGVIDMLAKIKDQINQIYVDDVMVLFEGAKVSMICHLANHVTLPEL